MQKVCPQSKEKHFFTLEKYQAQPEHSGFGDLTLTEQSKGKTMPVTSSRVKELI